MLAKTRRARLGRPPHEGRTRFRGEAGTFSVSALVGGACESAAQLYHGALALARRAAPPGAPQASKSRTPVARRMVALSPRYFRDAGALGVGAGAEASRA
jgi:hypothetical protein